MLAQFITESSSQSWSKTFDSPDLWVLSWRECSKGMNYDKITAEMLWMALLYEVFGAFGWNCRPGTVLGYLFVCVSGRFLQHLF